MLTITLSATQVILAGIWSMIGIVSFLTVGTKMASKKINKVINK